MTAKQWEARLIGAYDDGNIYEVRCGPFMVADYITGAEAAHLIAAAPELFEALTKIVKYANSEPDGGTYVQMHRANIERARAAIDKATKGDQP